MGIHILRRARFLALAVALACGFGFARAEVAVSSEAPVAEKLVVREGLFRIEQNPDTGDIFMTVRADQIGKEFIYAAYVENGVANLASRRRQGESRDRGALLEDVIVKIVRPDNRRDHIQIIKESSGFFYDPASPLARSAGADVSGAVLADVEATPVEGGKAFVIPADFLLSEQMAQVLPRAFAESSRSNPSTTKTTFVAVHNHKDNTDLLVDYVYEDLGKSEFAQTWGSADGRYLTVRVQHSFIALPDSDYAPRAFDDRVGYFAIARNNLSSTSVVPYDDFILRWNLKKKDPNAPISEPITPITFWIENTTPVNARESVEKGVLSWNKAFEAAGFKNAIVVKIQPDDADWQAGDIHHNVIRWVSTTGKLRYVGYSPVIFDPRTGEILCANIMLDFSLVTEPMRQDELFNNEAKDNSSARIALAASKLDWSSFFNRNFALGAALANSSGETGGLRRLIDETIQSAAVHEVGHALGLAHNFRGSTIRPLSELAAGDLQKYPLSSSVMDYLAINIAPKGQHQGAYFQTMPGPYDVWAIRYGYTPPLGDPAAESARIKALLSQSTQPQLAYGSQELAGIDPRVQEFDLSSDPIDWAKDRFELVRQTMSELKDKFVRPGESYEALVVAYEDLMFGEKLRAADALVTEIGGIYVERATPDEPHALPPFTAVPGALQRKAMKTLADNVFAPDAFAIPSDVARYLQPQERGGNYVDMDVVNKLNHREPRVYSDALLIQDGIIADLLDPARLERLTESRAYGNTYETREMLSDLTNAIFASDANTSVNAFRQQLQTDYVEMLIGSLQGDGRVDDSLARAAIYEQLRNIQSQSGFRLTALFANLDLETQAHRNHIHHLISVALDGTQHQ